MDTILETEGEDIFNYSTTEMPEDIRDIVLDTYFIDEAPRPLPVHKTSLTSRESESPERSIFLEESNNKGSLNVFLKRQMIECQLNEAQIQMDKLVYIEKEIAERRYWNDNEDGKKRD